MDNGVGKSGFRRRLDWVVCQEVQSEPWLSSRIETAIDVDAAREQDVIVEVKSANGPVDQRRRAREPYLLGKLLRFDDDIL